jgi:SAM-dependent methyltransferase
VVEHRRSALRTAAVWGALQQALQQPGQQTGQQAGQQAEQTGQQDQQQSPSGWGDPCRVVDLGGGTGGFAVRLAGQGHEVTVVDPSPDALAALDRRAAEADVADRVRGVQGDATDLGRLVGESSVDLVLCHGVLEVVDDPAETLAASVGVLVPGGLLSLLVAHQPAAVLARVLAGRLDEALELLRDGSGASVPRRFTEAEVLGLLAEAGVDDSPYLHGARVFTDLVPGTVVDEPGATDLLLDLELLAADRPELRALASQLHVLSRRR